MQLHLGWHAQRDGTSFYGISVENGRLTPALRRAVREAVESLGLRVRLTPQQDLLLRDVTDRGRAGGDPGRRRRRAPRVGVAGAAQCDGVPRQAHLRPRDDRSREDPARLDRRDRGGGAGRRRRGDPHDGLPQHAARGRPPPRSGSSATARTITWCWSAGRARGRGSRTSSSGACRASACSTALVGPAAGDPHAQPGRSAGGGVPAPHAARAAAGVGRPRRQRLGPPDLRGILPSAPARRGSIAQRISLSLPSPQSTLTRRDAERLVAQAVDAGRLERAPAERLGAGLCDPSVREAVLEGACESKRRGKGERRQLLAQSLHPAHQPVPRPLRLLHLREAPGFGRAPRPTRWTRSPR